MTTGRVQHDQETALLHASSGTPTPSQSLSEPQLLPAAITGAIFAPALKRLVSSKRTLELTAHQAETWLSALSIYAERPQIVVMAVIEIATSEDPFPDLAKLLTKCEKIRRQMDNTMPQDESKVRFTNVNALAVAWGLAKPRSS